MLTEPEFAEEYTLKERIRIIGSGLITGVIMMFVAKDWLFPSVKAFAESASCRKVFGVEGLTLLWYGLFTGMPLFWGVIILVTFGLIGYKTLRDKQYPPRRHKVFKATEIVKGVKARWIAYLFLSSCLPFMVMGLWGYGQAGEMSKATHAKFSECLVNNSE